MFFVAPLTKQFIRYIVIYLVHSPFLEGVVDVHLTSEELETPEMFSGEREHDRASMDGDAPTSAEHQEFEKRDAAKAQEAQQNIIWIASYPKSGNTWVRVFVHNLLRELRGETEGSQDINDLGRYAIWEHSYPHYTQVLGKSPTIATNEELARARPAVQSLISKKQKGLSLTKTHLCFGADHDVPTINLNVTLAAIYIVRNPMDVAISYAHHCSRPVDAIIADMARPGFRTPPTENHVGELLESWSQHVASWMGIASRPVHIIRYEDMLAFPGRSFGSIARFLGLNPTEAQLRSAVQKSSFAELAKQEAEHGFKEKPKRAERFFRSGTAGQWREALSPEQVNCILADHASMMQRVRYLPPRSHMSRDALGGMLD